MLDSAQYHKYTEYQYLPFQTLVLVFIRVDPIAISYSVFSLPDKKLSYISHQKISHEDTHVQKFHTSNKNSVNFNPATIKIYMLIHILACILLMNRM